MEKDQKTRYLRAQKSSFKTKLDLYVFHTALKGIQQLQLSEFLDFTISKELVKLYSSAYWQKGHEEAIGLKAITVKTLYENMQSLKKSYAGEFESWQKDYAERFKTIYPHDEFEKLLENAQCEYCSITEEDIRHLGAQGKLFKKSERGWSLEIDRKNSNFEYSPDNCVMACYWCNNAKTDEFTFEEFKIIGKSMEEVWRARLNSNKS
jgi:hypothetical protein